MYRPVGIRCRCGRERPPLAVPFAMEYPDRAPKERYFDPGFYALEDRAALVANLADGVPARGDPAAVRLRRVRDPRPADRRGPHRGRRGSGVSERVPAPRGEGGGRPRLMPVGLHLPVPRLVLRARRQEHRRHPAAHLQRAQPGAGRARSGPGALRDLGRLRLDQPRRRAPHRCAPASSRSRR